MTSYSDLGENPNLTLRKHLGLSKNCNNARFLSVTGGTVVCSACVNFNQDNVGEVLVGSGFRAQPGVWHRKGFLQ